MTGRPERTSSLGSRWHSLAWSFVLEWSRKQPITYVSLLRRRKMLKNAYMEGAALLIKHKQQVQEGHEEAGQLVTSSSYVP